ncbi:MAG TPA: DNA polymerase [Ilumatobacteraceae bacterium]|nr:DNA polymerase [Ilumatobacteraceae bacterium]
MTGSFAPGDTIAIAYSENVGAALVADTGVTLEFDETGMFATLIDIEQSISPRWVWWTADTARALVAVGVRPARCWDLESVHRLLVGGWRGGAGRIWAHRRGLDAAELPQVAAPDLFSQPGGNDHADAVRPDGHLDPLWIDELWNADLEHLRTWAGLALDVHHWQLDELARLPGRPAASSTARSESAAALLCAELEADGLPIDVAEAERIISSFIGPRPIDTADEARLAAERDQLVLRHLPGSLGDLDLRNPAGVKSLLRRVGIEVPDTRAWRLERLRDQHEIVDALLTWRKAERIATTFGYRWLDRHVGPGGRLRGQWSPSDGAAGRMTATAGLHNMPAELRPAIVAERNHMFVRADLGQIEPRILAAVSNDDALAAATWDDDMYAPVAARLGVTRDVAKVAVLGAMYGQTTGHGAVALRGLESAYPIAMAFLETAARQAEGGNDLRTRGGRLVRMSDPIDEPGDAPTRSRAAARGRYGRNAMVQGAAAEFFKTWAAIVRARCVPIDALIVLCLHDELLVHCRSDCADAASDIVTDGVQEASHRWSGANRVRFVADTSVITRWSEAT